MLNADSLVGEDIWIPNNGTATDNIITNCSGAQRPTLACWKAVDGLLLFNDDQPSTDQGWDGAAEPGTTTEWLEVDLGQDNIGKVDRVGIYSVDQSDDPKWFPNHDPDKVCACMLVVCLFVGVSVCVCTCVLFDDTVVVIGNLG